MYKLYSTFIASPLVIILTAIVGISVAITSLIGLNALADHYIPFWWGKLTFWLYLFDVKVIGREKIDKNQSYIFLANHQSYLDIPLMYMILNHSFKWMLKEYLKKMPIIGFACIYSRHIFVGESISSIQNAIQDARKILLKGISMSIFPEGTRTSDGKIQPFKRGAFMLANEIGLSMVPITINGTFNAFSRNARYVTRSSLIIIIHDPITVSDRKGKTTKAIMQEVQEIIEKGVVQ